MASLKRNGIIYSLILAALIVGSFSAPAYIQGGEGLVEFMRAYEEVSASKRAGKKPDYIDAERFRSFVIGVSDSLSGQAFCLPAKRAQSTMVQICDVVAKYLNAHPEEWREPGHVLVTRALKQAFPCKGVTRR